MKNPRALFGLAVIAFSALTGSAIADDLVKMEAVNLKFISAPLSKEQIVELIQIPPRK
jgi:hypothetical protein